MKKAVFVILGLSFLGLLSAAQAKIVAMGEITHQYVYDDQKGIMNLEPSHHQITMSEASPISSDQQRMLLEKALFHPKTETLFGMGKFEDSMKTFAKKAKETTVKVLNDKKFQALASTAAVGIAAVGAYAGLKNMGTEKEDMGPAVEEPKKGDPFVGELKQRHSQDKYGLHN